ncbi:MAG: serine/threonine protein kinase [Acidobacteria bacterium]|nr:serine/threonine protein kinase [Acidobacteriota bacterium]
MLAPNTLLQDRYLVMRLLGQGGMGAVYQATDRKFGNAVALKETFYNDLQLRKAFSHEARLLNRLRHAALPVVTDYFAIGERQFLVMQYIPGKDLEQLLADRKTQGQGVFVSSQVLRWADQLLDALEYLHSQKPPIIHRDIKPQNLKLTPRGEVILLDFGLAKGIVTHQSQASQSIRGYTPNYASLEQIRGTGTDARSDIYSIGATIYHLLTGEMPQDALTRIAAILMGQPDPMKPIASMNPTVPAAVTQVIEKAMSPHPDQRYSSAAAMRQALRSAAINTPPVSLHRAQTLTDEPMKVHAAADPRPRNGSAVLPQFPAPLPAVANQPAANPQAPIQSESQIPDHVIILLENLGKNSQGKVVREEKVQERNDRGPEAPVNNLPERKPQGPGAPVRKLPERNLRRQVAPKQNLQENHLRRQDAPKKNLPEKNLGVAAAREKDDRGKGLREKSVRGKALRGRSFFQRKIARIREVSAQPEQSRKNRQAPAKPAPRKSLIYGLGAPLLITLILGILVYKAYQTWPELFAGAAELVSTTQTNVGNFGGPTLAISTRVEVLRYYLEIASSNNTTRGEETRATGLESVEGGTKFKFHFKLTEGGYLYMLALGKNGVPQTFLTSQPMPASGVTTNWSAAGADFNFPDGGQWFMIQKDAEVTPFTVIFSKTPLKTPAFLSSQSGRELSEAERQELTEFQKRYGANPPELVATKDGNQPIVAIQSLGDRAANEPIIFDVSIKRK